jgi:hypothetical protein
MRLKTYQSEINSLTYSYWGQFIIMVGFIFSSVNNMALAFGGSNLDYAKAIFFDGIMISIATSINYSVAAGRQVGIRKSAMWAGMIFSGVFNLFYKWTLLNPETTGLYFEDFYRTSIINLVMDFFAMFTLPFGVLIMSKVSQETLSDRNYYQQLEDKLIIGRERRLITKTRKAEEKIHPSIN